MGESDGQVREDELFRMLVESAQDYAIFTTDLEGRILTWNVGAERILGWPQAEAVGRSCEMIFVERDREAGAPVLERQLAARVGRAENERWHLRRDGSLFWGAGIMLPLRDDQGRHHGFAKILRDFTRRRELEHALLKQQRMESVGVLAGGVAHQFNNLLTIIGGNLEMLARSSTLDAEGRRMLADAVSAGQRAAALTSQLLAYAGRSRYQVQPLELCGELEHVMGLLVERVPSRIRVVIEAPSPCPTVDADPAQLRMLVSQLVLNAVEAIGERPGTVRLSSRVEAVSGEAARRRFAEFDLRPGAYVRLDVIDDGPGMDAATQARVFEPFFSTKFQGRGLGLAAVLGAVRSHEGAIAVQSAPGQGTTFTILLPASGASLPPAGVETPPDDPGRPLALVADDEELVRSIVATILEEEGYTVVQAENGEQAVSMLTRLGSAVKLVVLDLIMPAMGGEAAMPRLRAVRPDVPVVVMTGFGAVEAQERLRDHGVQAFLTKPFTLDRLVEAIRAALAGEERRA